MIDQMPTVLRMAGPELRALATWLTITGGSALVLGFVTIVWPAATVVAVAWLIGAHLIVAGIAVIALGSHSPRPNSTSWMSRAVLGGLALIAGVSTLAWPGATARTLATILGLAFIVSGIGDIVTGLAWRHQVRAFGWVIISGVVSIAIGAVALVWPGITVWALAIVAGGNLIVVGALVSMVAWRLRRAAQQMESGARVLGEVAGRDSWSENGIQL